MVIENEIRMLPFEETHGRLRSVQQCDGYILAEVGPVTLLLPTGTHEMLKGLIGLKIAIIRTDIAHKEYIVRTVDEATIRPQNLPKLGASKDGSF